MSNARDKNLIIPCLQHVSFPHIVLLEDVARFVLLSGCSSLDLRNPNSDLLQIHEK